MNHVRPEPVPVRITDALPPVASTEQLFQEQLGEVHRRSDRLMAWVLGMQWLAGVTLACTLSPFTWHGALPALHPHFYLATVFGGAITAPALVLVLTQPGSRLTRHTVAVAQVLWSAVLFHLTGGRTETNFHVFGSLAFLAFYRDWRVLLTATLTISADHLVRGLLWPNAVYGISNPEWWRFLEYSLWVAFEGVVLVMGIAQGHREMRALAARQHETESLRRSVERTVIERTRELTASREQYRSLLETTRMVPWEMDDQLNAMTYVGPQGAELLGCDPTAWTAPNFWSSHLHPDDVARTRETFERTIAEGGENDLEVRLRHEDGRWLWVRCLLGAAVDGDRHCLRGVLLDITHQRQLEIELAQAQKLESVGRLASGVAHEINTPVQFVTDSIQFLRLAHLDVSGLLRRYGDLREAAAAHPDLAAAAEQLKADEEGMDLEYLREQAPRAFDRAVDGLSRVATLVRSMKEFAHPDQPEKCPADLNHALTSTLTIARNEYKYVAELETEFGEIPEVCCHVGELNQAFLNIIVNAAHAISDRVKGTPDRGKIRVVTRADGDHVVVEISDTGGGIPESVGHRIFEPFFTTKEVGRGTGQGLPIARTVVVNKHGGTLGFVSHPGQGTTFTIRLPIQPQRDEEWEAAA